MIGDETTGITDGGRHVRAHLRCGHWLPPQSIGGRYS